MNSQLKTLIAVFLTFLSINCHRSNPVIDLPKTKELLDDLTIQIPPSPSRTYGVTDHIGGFWQGQSFDYNTEGGYTVYNEKFFIDFLSYQDNHLLDRRQAKQFNMHPKYSEHLYTPDSKISISVLSEHHGLSLSLFGHDAKPWKFIPLFSSKSQPFIIQEDTNKNCIYIGSHRHKTMLAIISSRAGTWQKSGLKHTAHIPNAIAPLKFTTTKNGPCTLYLLFNDDLENLSQKVTEITENPASFLDRREQRVEKLIRRSYLKTNIPELDRALHWAKISGHDLVVTRFGKGIWAGLPWFNQNWGRDKFIALPGISLVTGHFQEAIEIIENFAEYQITDPDHPLYGRVPNRVISPIDIIYNTTDGTPWLIREIAETVFYTGDRTFARRLFPVLEHAIKGTQTNFIDSLGFMTHDDADTWMDARIRGKEAWSPRGNRAVEIQALWINQLLTSADIAEELGYHAQAEQWTELAGQVQINFNKAFIDPNLHTIYDHLNRNGTPDRQIRPNQIFALTIPLTRDIVDPLTISAIVNQVTSELTYPYGVASLSQNDQYFHPYHHDQIYHFDAAYHNGLCWQWLAGPVVEALVRTGQPDIAFELTMNLTQQLLYRGMPGSISELVEPELKNNHELVLSGTYSQAWSVSEFLRTFYQAYLGIKINMLKRTIKVAPRWPRLLNDVRFITNFGNRERIDFHIRKNKSKWNISADIRNIKKPVTIQFELPGDGPHFFSVETTATDQQQLRLTGFDPIKKVCHINGKIRKMCEHELFAPSGKKPDFCRFARHANRPSLSIPDYLEKIRLAP